MPCYDRNTIKFAFWNSYKKNEETYSIIDPRCYILISIYTGWPIKHLTPPASLQQDIHINVLRDTVFQ